MSPKQKRHRQLVKLLEENPFLTDQELSTLLKVSIQTVRLDRMALGISELRDRIRSVAEVHYDKITAINRREIVGEIISLEVGKEAISVLHTEADMTFEGSTIIKGSTIFAMAESLALVTIDKRAALSGVANLKYQIPVQAGEVLLARAMLRTRREKESIIHVTIHVHNEQVFRAKFIMRHLGDQDEIGN